MPFIASLRSHLAKALQGIGYRAALRKTPYRTGCWPISAHADEATRLLKGVRFTNGKESWDEHCDLLACGFHLVPNTELASLLGCTLRGDFVQVNDQQQTSVTNIYCAGEPTGIAGLDAALIQGEIAGLGCAAQPTSFLVLAMRPSRNLPKRLEAPFAFARTPPPRRTRYDRLPLRRCHLRESRCVAADGPMQNFKPAAEWVRARDASVDPPPKRSLDGRRSRFARLYFRFPLAHFAFTIPNTMYFRRMHDLVWRNARNDDTV